MKLAQIARYIPLPTRQCWKIDCVQSMGPPPGTIHFVLEIMTPWALSHVPVEQQIKMRYNDHENYVTRTNSKGIGIMIPGKITPFLTDRLLDTLWIFRFKSFFYLIGFGNNICNESNAITFIPWLIWNKNYIAIFCRQRSECYNSYLHAVVWTNTANCDINISYLSY